MDGRDVLDLPPSAARRSAAQRSRHRQRHPQGLPAPQKAHPRTDSQDRRAVASLPIGSELVPVAKPRAAFAEAAVGKPAGSEAHAFRIPKGDSMTHARPLIALGVALLLAPIQAQQKPADKDK